MFDQSDQSDDDEVDTNNSIQELSNDEENDLEDLETVSVRPTFFAQGDGGVETILNLREWLKSPWTEKE